MKPAIITFASCLFCFLNVQFQTVPAITGSCRLAGWLGSQCSFKCRCDRDKCNPDGECSQPFSCQAGWFGPACQYADLAFNRSTEAVITDGKDTTCASPGNVSIALNIPLGQSYVFTWIRIKVSENGKKFLPDLTVTFFQNAAIVSCKELLKHYVQEDTLDIHCNSPFFTEEVTIIGRARSYLCSVYVSGGRNVAVNETAFQQTTYFEHYIHHSVPYGAELAVDTSYSTCSQTGNISSPDDLPQWKLTLSEVYLVNRYVIYNRPFFYDDYLRGFTLESFDAANNLVFEYEDNSDWYQPVYSIIHTPKHVKSFVVSVNNTGRSLNLCEFEVFGDSICNRTHFGVDCEIKCACSHSRGCFVNTGGCSKICPSGYYGYECRQECVKGTFGNFCSSLCSPNCQTSSHPYKSPCDKINGACIVGCNIGFVGTSCESDCPFGKFGRSCLLSCNTNCLAATDQPMSPCDSKNGSCLNGCKPGFRGKTCERKCDVGKFGDDCTLMCSKRCEVMTGTAISACNASTGACIKGCISGYYGEYCKKECTAGKFGKNCKSECSKRCALPTVPHMSACDHLTGKCLIGCKEGFSGNKCQDIETVSWQTIGLSTPLVGMPTALCLCYWCCKRKPIPLRPPEEGTTGKIKLDRSQGGRESANPM